MGRGDNPSRNWNALQNALLLRVSELWMGSAVSQMDDPRSEPRAGNQRHTRTRNVSLPTQAKTFVTDRHGTVHLLRHIAVLQ